LGIPLRGSSPSNALKKLDAKMRRHVDGSMVLD
jgi:hypothetical protein